MTFDCPAKINLFLAVCGKRPDGFHELISVVSKVSFGDQLHVHYDVNGLNDHFEVQGAHRKLIENNCIETAVNLYRKKFSIDRGALSVELEKNIPVGAGLGGGSSDAVAMLKACHHFWGKGSLSDLKKIAADIGSDCPLFLFKSGVVMRGRGEIIEELSSASRKALSGKEIILFKPSFSIETKTAYERLAASKLYGKEAILSAEIDDWQAAAVGLPPRYNDFERLIESWYPSLAVVLDQIRHDLGYDVRMSGSGSSSFAFTNGDKHANVKIRKVLESAWGENYFCLPMCIQ